MNEPCMNAPRRQTLILETPKKKYQIKDIVPYCLVSFKKHNGKGKPITIRTIFVNSIFHNARCSTIFYETYEGEKAITISGYKKNDYEIVDIKYFERNELGELELL